MYFRPTNTFAPARCSLQREIRNNVFDLIHYFMKKITSCKVVLIF